MLHPWWRTHAAKIMLAVWIMFAATIPSPGPRLACPNELLSECQTGRSTQTQRATPTTTMRSRKSRRGRGRRDFRGDCVKVDQEKKKCAVRIQTSESTRTFHPSVFFPFHGQSWACLGRERHCTVQRALRTLWKHCQERFAPDVGRNREPGILGIVRLMLLVAGPCKHVPAVHMGLDKCGATRLVAVLLRSQSRHARRLHHAHALAVLTEKGAFDVCPAGRTLQARYS